MRRSYRYLRGGHSSGSGFHSGRRRFSRDESGGERYPRGLKGRDIGLWYANRAKQKKTNNKPNYGVVHMDSSQLELARDALQASKLSKHCLQAKVEDGEVTCSSIQVPEKVSNMMHQRFSGRNEPEDISKTQTKVATVISCNESNVRENLNKNSDAYSYMMGQCRRLPAFKMRKELLDVINSNQVVVISGETGCGKTTQIPQFILDDAIEHGKGSSCKVVCTQPRRISAISVAERVARERNERCGEGNSCGYQIRLQSKLPRKMSSVLYCTTGILIQWLQCDPLISEVSHVILDEIHERDLLSDFLIAIVKGIVSKRKDLKVILMSATLNADMFSTYFDDCPKINIPGFTFPVTEYYLEDAIKMTSYRPPNKVYDDFYKLTSMKQNWRMMRGAIDRDERQDMLNKQKVYVQELQAYEKELQKDHSEGVSRVICSLDAYLQKNLDYELIVEVVRYVILNPSNARCQDGAILIFVPGWEDIKNLNNLFSKDTAFFQPDRYLFIPLHSLMPTVNQQQVFERPSPGVTKIVIATNIAETSITIDDIVYVINCGKIKVRTFEHGKNISTLAAKWISRANAKQRKGRAGRVQEGHCFHLYTKRQETNMNDYMIPEILRTPLDQLSLQIKLLGLGRIKEFVSQLLELPAQESVDLSIKKLTMLNALDDRENLTALGQHLARLPVEPQIGKMLLFGAIFSCLEPILTIAASLSFKDPFVIPLGKEKQADIQRRSLTHSNSDHIMLVNAYNGWVESASYGYAAERNYCWKNFLSSSTMKMLKDMRGQFARYLHDAGFINSLKLDHRRFNQHSHDNKIIQAVVCSGLYPNVAKISKLAPHKPPRISTMTERKVAFHPKSVNCDKASSQFDHQWLCYYEKMKTSAVYLHDSSEISSFPLLFFGGEIDTFVDEDGNNMISVEGWIKFKAKPDIAHTVQKLRQELDKILERKVKNPNSLFDDAEISILNTISQLISRE